MENAMTQEKSNPPWPEVVHSEHVSRGDHRPASQLSMRQFSWEKHGSGGDGRSGSHIVGSQCAQRRRKVTPRLFSIPTVGLGGLLASPTASQAQARRTVRSEECCIVQSYGHHPQKKSAQVAAGSWSVSGSPS